ncbi:MAG TPA: adenylate/guanylate cyclase domain-containing protein [Acidimicrobiia bacterium]|nr:adenylate/guanylate cyclase domain-containing protein [Acidimicrobiia bacterium]
MKQRRLIRRIVSIAALTVVVTTLAAIGLNAEVFGGFQRRATDALFPSAPDDGDIAVVGFDTTTINTEGLGNPLPRAKVAQMVDNLKAAGARVIAFDVIYRTEQPGDDVLRDAIDRAGNVILAREPTIGPTRDGIYTTKDISALSPVLSESNHAEGQVHLNKDPSDGISRSVPLVVSNEDDTEFVPALSVMAVMLDRGISPSQFIVRKDGIQMGNRFVPTEDAKSLTLNFSPELSTTANVISAADVINGTFPKKKVDGKIVFIGATATTLGDVKTAPVNKSTDLPGVMFHANAANTMLTGTYLEPVDNTQTLLWVAALTALIGTAVLLLPLWMSILFTVLLGAGYIVFAFQQFNSGNVLNFVYPSLAVIVAFMGALGVRYFGETRQRRHITTLFSQYVPEAVAQRLVDEDRASIAVEGERLDMTVLFCDLRGFTAMSENLEPAIVRTMLNHYYDRVTDVVLAMDGTLMKYVGDEVFAVWGAPLPSSDHPTRALECAIAIQALTPDLNRELVEQGAPEVSFGIGLNTGEAVAAHFGGGRRRQYDVVGDTVNVGARLCSAAGRGDIILSDQVLSRVTSPPPVEPVGPIELKGVSRELRLWRVVRSGSASLPESVVAREAAAAVPEG